MEHNHNAEKKKDKKARSVAAKYSFPRYILFYFHPQLNSNITFLDIIHRLVLI
jgi:hypothetical protein